MAAVLAEWRRPASTCRGGLVLSLRDLEPGAGWGILDHDARPKPAARALAAVLAPVALWILDEGLGGLRVHLANDPGVELEGRLTLRLVREDGKVVEEASRAVRVPAHGHLEVDVEELLGRFVDASYAYRFGPPAHARAEAVLVCAHGERAAVWTRPDLDAPGAER